VDRVVVPPSMQLVFGGVLCVEGMRFVVYFVGALLEEVSYVCNSEVFTNYRLKVCKRGEYAF
jgi:hypothetical protein